MTTTPAASIVATMIAGWQARDAEAVAACFTEDGVWHNTPYAPIAGRAAIAGAVGAFLGGMAEAEFRVHFQAESGPNTILNERTDIFRTADGRTITIPVMGVFEVEDGLIRSWRDYFDPAAMNG